MLAIRPYLIPMPGTRRLRSFVCALKLCSEKKGIEKVNNCFSIYTYRLQIRWKL